MPYKDILAPASAEYLIKLFRAVYTPCRLGQSVNIITFSGAGKWANLNFLSDYTKEFDETYPPTAYIFLNAKQLAFSVEEELKNGISFMVARAAVQKNEMLTQLANKIPNSYSIIEFIQTLRTINEQGQRVIIFIDNADFLAQKDRKAQLALATLTTLEQTHTSRMSYVFITKAEISGTLSHLGRIEKYFTQNIVTESDIPHDEACVAAYVKRFESTRNVTFSSVSKEKLQVIAKGMPILSKHFIEKYQLNTEFKLIIDNNSENIAEIYEADEHYLNSYFEELMFRLSPSSKDFLFKISSQPTNYIKSAGLIDENCNPINEIFRYYLQNKGHRYAISTGLDALSAQEKRVFQLLLDSLGKIVTREEIARALWQENWQSKYSEQSIDKAVSNIRAKLPDDQYRITSAKGIGVIAEKI